MADPTIICPCGSNRSYSKCCSRYIESDKPAPIAEALMCSRYTAYTLGAVDYILATWAEETRSTVDKASLIKSCKETNYHSLRIISKRAGTRKHNQGQVEFEVSFSALGKHQTHREISNFIKHNDQWYYVDAAEISVSS